jgi:hypothetical protein
MKVRHLLPFLLLSFAACNPGPKDPPIDMEFVVFQPGDKEILQQVFDSYSADRNEPMQDLMVKVGEFFLGTPYVAHTLENENEQLVINLREVDCTTLAESCLAISRSIKSGNHSFEQFASELMGIRYRDRVVSGYPSRLHYFCDWIHTNHLKGLIVDVSREIAGTPFPKQVNFMSTHPGSYRQLKEDTTLIEVIAQQEKAISAREMYYIPESRLREAETGLKDGDIVGITTDTEGLAISHVVILVRQSGRIHLLHASSLAEKVVISEGTLEEYLRQSKTATGIMVARPL